MFARALLPVLLVLAGSCVPQARVERALPVAAERLSAEDFRHLPAAEIPRVIDSVTAPGPAARPFTAAAASPSALDCLTEAVYYEARGEPIEGQRAVAQVVLNRVRHPAFPRSVCGVVFQGAHRSTGCQFSFTCDGSMRGARNRGAWERAREVAAAALSGYVFAPVGLATHFHADYVRPWWAGAMRRAVKIGAHIFYRWPGQWGDPLNFRRPYQGGEGRPWLRADDGAGSNATELVAGVAIHRGGSAASAEIADPARGEATPAPAPTAAPVRLAAVETVSGVRVHRAAARTDRRLVADVTVHRRSADPAPAPDAADGNAEDAALTH